MSGDIIYYDEYISLGDNCEAGMNFRRIGYEYGSIFRFAMSPYVAMFDALSNDFSGLFDSVSPASDTMAYCDKYRIAFHCSLHSENIDGKRVFSINGTEFQQALEKERSKIKFLITRMYQDCSSGKNMLYLLKQNSGISTDQILAVSEKIKSLSGGNPFTLVCLSDKMGLKTIRLDSNVFIEPVRYFSPYVGGWNYDQQAYDQIFHKYPMRLDRLRIAK